MGGVKRGLGCNVVVSGEDGEKRVGEWCGYGDFGCGIGGFGVGVN